jgi:Na+-driven multidrug efflux pump
MRLRGLQDVRFPLMVNIISFLLIGVYVSYYLGFFSTQGVCGLAYGELITITFSALLLLLRLFKKLNDSYFYRI